MLKYIFLIILISGAISIYSLELQNNKSEQIDNYIKLLVEKKYFSGTIFVALRDQIIFNKNYGFANYEHNIPNKSDTKFRIASITKSFTALATLQLQDQGLLNIGDFVNQYIPDYPNGDKIKISHLLLHTSGIPNISAFDNFQDIIVLQISLSQFIAYFKDKPLEFVPGSQYKYSNSGYLLLSAILEKVSGKTFGQIINDNIFVPLGMKDSGYDHPRDLINNRASGYILKNNNLENSSYINMDLAVGSGGLYSTVQDLYLFDRVLYKNNFAKIFHDYNYQYCYGWNVDKLFGHKLVYHIGNMFGFSAIFYRFIDDDVCIIILSNFEHAPVEKIAQVISAIIFDKQWDAIFDTTIKEIRIDPKLTESYIGHYLVSSGQKITIFKEKDRLREYQRLFMKYFGQDKIELYQQSKNKFIDISNNIIVEFIKDDKNIYPNLSIFKDKQIVEANKIL